MKLGRRTFLQIAGATGTAALVTLPGRAQAIGGVETKGEDESSVLVDTTKCIGCRGCEAACAEANHLPDPPDDEKAFEKPRQTSTQVFTVVNRSPVKPRAGGERFAKTQCMHCVEPACASACPAKALEKTASGPVVYHQERCLGCRYCMVACPFGVPQFEYEKTAPYIRKCSFCADRQAAGKLPACADACPSGALQFGNRAELLEEARTRIYQNPGKYVHHVYGET